MDRRWGLLRGSVLLWQGANLKAGLAASAYEAQRDAAERVGARLAHDDLDVAQPPHHVGDDRGHVRGQQRAVRLAQHAEHLGAEPPRARARRRARGPCAAMQLRVHCGSERRGLVVEWERVSHPPMYWRFMIEGTGIRARLIGQTRQFQARKDTYEDAGEDSLSV